MKKALILFADIFNTGGVQQYNKNLCDFFAREFDSVEFTGISLYDLRSGVNGKIWPNIRIKFCDAVKIRAIQRIIFVIVTLATALMERPVFLICCHVNLVFPGLFLKKLFNHTPNHLEMLRWELSAHSYKYRLCQSISGVKVF